MVDIPDRPVASLRISHWATISHQVAGIRMAESLQGRANFGASWMAWTHRRRRTLLLHTRERSGPAILVPYSHRNRPRPCPALSVSTLHHETRQTSSASKAIQSFCERLCIRCFAGRRWQRDWCPASEQFGSRRTPSGALAFDRTLIWERGNEPCWQRSARSSLRRCFR